MRHSTCRPYEDGTCKPDMTGLEPGILDRYAALCNRYGVRTDEEQTSLSAYLDNVRKLHAGLKAVQLENDTWRVTLLPDTNGKIVEMTYKPTGRNIVQAARGFDRFRYEEWVRQGEGPSPETILAYQVQAQPNKALLTLTTPDGTRIERTITLAGDAVRFETVMTANAPRTFDFQIHPEYDTATASDDPKVVCVYVKAPEWVNANRGWKHALPDEAQNALIRNAVAGGAFAYYNHKAKFGVEETFKPEEFNTLGLFWGPSRQQVNLELFPRMASLEKGQQARFSYEVRYLDHAPVKP